MISCRLAVQCSLVLLLPSGGRDALDAFAAHGAPEWPQWRGPNRDGVSTEKGLLQKWAPAGPPLAWKASGLGKGLASVAISAGRIYTMGKRKGAQVLLALDLRDGREVWAAVVREKGGEDPH